MASELDVYVGFWINWTGGRLEGATLTLRSRDGAYLVAFLALIVRIAGNHFWRLLCYLAFHTLPRSSGSLDVQWTQQRAILRNSYSALDAAAKFGRIAVSTWNEVGALSLGPLLLLSTALLNVAGFTIAGIFSSAVTRAQSSVLLRPTTCGRWLDASVTKDSEWDQDAMVRSIDLVSVIHRDLVTSSRLHLACSGASNPSEYCNAYGGRPIAFTASNVSCPFDASICLGSAAVSLDSGVINSHTDLGINAPESDRVAVRKTIQCAPLRTAGHSQDGIRANSSLMQDTASYRNLTGYFYGSNLRVRSDFTYAYNPDSFQTSVGTGHESVPYQLDLEVAAFNHSINEGPVNSSTFLPIPELRLPNSNIMLAFLSNEAAYLSPTFDPWFNATELTVRDVVNSKLMVSAMPMYVSRKPVSVLGCAEQMQLCNSGTGNGKCIFLPPDCDVGDVTTRLALNPRQAAVMQRLIESLSRTALQESAFSLGGSGLLASSTIQDSMSPGLPNNQWELEVSNWFSTSLTALQLFTVQYVTGYGSPTFDRYVTSPDRKEKWMCTNQVVQRDDFASFSVLGLAIILSVCVFIIFLSESLSRIVSHIPSKSATKKRIELEWRAYDILEMRRRSADDLDAKIKDPRSPVISRRATQAAPRNGVLERWLMPWKAYRRRTQLRPDRSAQQAECSLSTSDLVPSEEGHRWNSVDTTASSPVSPQVFVGEEKV